MKVKHVALVGTGVIGASWATLFLAKGLEVFFALANIGIGVAFADLSSTADIVHLVGDGVIELGELAVPLLEKAAAAVFGGGSSLEISGTVSAH